MGAGAVTERGELKASINAVAAECGGGGVSHGTIIRRCEGRHSEKSYLQGGESGT